LKRPRAFGRIAGRRRLTREVAFLLPKLQHKKGKPCSSKKCCGGRRHQRDSPRGSVPCRNGINLPMGTIARRRVREVMPNLSQAPDRFHFGTGGPRAQACWRARDLNSSVQNLTRVAEEAVEVAGIPLELFLRRVGNHQPETARDLAGWVSCGPSIERVANSRWLSKSPGGGVTEGYAKSILTMFFH